MKNTRLHTLLVIVFTEEGGTDLSCLCNGACRRGGDRHHGSYLERCFRASKGHSGSSVGHTTYGPGGREGRHA